MSPELSEKQNTKTNGVLYYLAVLVSIRSCMSPYTLHNTPRSTYTTWVLIHCKSQNNHPMYLPGHAVPGVPYPCGICLMISMTPSYNPGDDAVSFNLQPSYPKIIRVFTHLRHVELLSPSLDGAPPGQGVMASIGLNNNAVVGRNSQGRMDRDATDAVTGTTRHDRREVDRTGITDFGL